MGAINGWLNIYKPQGMTSFQMVALIKKITKQKKVGHAGTLDPLAEGILPIAIGQATKTIGFLHDNDPYKIGVRQSESKNTLKSYEFIASFGIKTSTADAEGEIIAMQDKVPAIEDLKAIIHIFKGKIRQRPHVYSAIKVSGKRSYDLARKGIVKKIAKRKVEIISLDLLKQINQTDFLFTVTCKKGVYIRSLVEDIAKKCKSVAFVKLLIRTSYSCFDKQDALNYSSKKQNVSLQMLKEKLCPTDIVLNEISALYVNDKQAKILLNGQSIEDCDFTKVQNCTLSKTGFYKKFLNQKIFSKFTRPIFIRAYLGKKLIAICTLKAGILKTCRVFNQ